MTVLPAGKMRCGLRFLTQDKLPLRAEYKKELRTPYAGVCLCGF